MKIKDWLFKEDDSPDYFGESNVPPWLVILFAIMAVAGLTLIVYALDHCNSRTGLRVDLPRYRVTALDSNNEPTMVWTNLLPVSTNTGQCCFWSGQDRVVLSGKYIVEEE